jgi:hypothetical protein
VSEAKPPASGEEPEERWLAELAGRSSASTDPEARLARDAGKLIRARFAATLSEVQAEPEPPATLERILARARTARRPRRAWMAPVFSSGMGLAAGLLIATVWFHGTALGPAFDAVTAGETLSPSKDTKSLELIEKQRYLIHTRDVAATAAALTLHLARAHANFRVESLKDGSVQIEVEPLPQVDPDLERVAKRLGVTIQSGEPLSFTVGPP